MDDFASTVSSLISLHQPLMSHLQFSHLPLLSSALVLITSKVVLKTFVQMRFRVGRRCLSRLLWPSWRQPLPWGLFILDFTLVQYLWSVFCFLFFKYSDQENHKKRTSKTAEGSRYAASKVAADSAAPAKTVPLRAGKDSSGVKAKSITEEETYRVCDGWVPVETERQRLL